MPIDARSADVAMLAGDPARAAMLHALMDGRALTVCELARAGGVAPQSASEHLAQLASGGLIRVQTQGRHRYHRIASAAVARMLGRVMRMASGSEAPRPPIATGPRDPALRAARTCYGHLAGRLGVALADALVARGHVGLAPDAGVITEPGIALLDRLGIDVAALFPAKGKRSRVLCRPCIDWSERRPHLAGAVGDALCAKSLHENWVRRIAGTRAVTVTPAGQRVFGEILGVDL